MVGVGGRVNVLVHRSRYLKGIEDDLSEGVSGNHTLACVGRIHRFHKQTRRKRTELTEKWNLNGMGTVQLMWFDQQWKATSFC